VSVNEMVALGKRPRTWRAETSKPPIQVTRTWSRWRSARGYKIHRAKFATFYQDSWASGGTRLCVSYMCGNSGNRPIPFREECAEGTSPCEKCERLFTAENSR